MEYDNVDPFECDLGAVFPAADGDAGEIIADGPLIGTPEGLLDVNLPVDLVASCRGDDGPGRVFDNGPETPAGRMASRVDGFVTGWLIMVWV